MSWYDSLRNLFSRKGFLDGEIIVKIPEQAYIKELALYSAVSLIANAISQCEILVYENGKQVRNGNWYSLNVQANTNESASQFWHKVIENMLLAGEGKGAFVFISGGNLYCADSYNIKERRPFKATGNLYDGIIVDTLELNRTFTGRDSMIFKLENRQANTLIDGMYADLSGLIASAVAGYKGANVPKWKFIIDSREAGSEQFQQQWQSKLKASIERYVSGTDQVYVEYEGRKLEPVASGQVSSASAEDNVKLINEVFDLVARAYHIPPGLMTAGNYNLTDVMTQFLTFTIDPIADMIGKTLTAAYGQADFERGNYFRVDTSKIIHFDVFAMASNVDKLISSGFASVNETRKAADWDAAGDPDDPYNWLNNHILTKNYVVGGEQNEAETV